MASHVDDDDDDAWSGSGCEAADEEPKVASITDPSKLYATAQEGDTIRVVAQRGSDFRNFTTGSTDFAPRPRFRAPSRSGD